jgi:hypothetical protein
MLAYMPLQNPAICGGCPERGCAKAGRHEASNWVFQLAAATTASTANAGTGLFLGCIDWLNVSEFEASETMRISYLKWLVRSAILGLIVPVCYLFWRVIVWQFGLVGGMDWCWQVVILTLWPSSIFLMATNGTTDVWTHTQILSMSITVNVILYCLVGSVAWFVKLVVMRAQGRRAQ